MLLRSSPLLVAAAFAAMLSAQQDPPASAPAATPPAAPPAAKARAEQPHFRALHWPADKDAAIAVVGTRTLTLTDLVDHLEGRHHPGFKEALTVTPTVEAMLRSDLMAPWVRHFADLEAMRQVFADELKDAKKLEEVTSGVLKKNFQAYLDSYVQSLKEQGRPTELSQRRVNLLLADYQLRNGLANEIQGMLDFLETDDRSRGELQQFFNDNARAFGGQVTIEHILVQHRDAGTGLLLREEGIARANERLAQIKARLKPDGSNFEEIARLYSEDQKTAPEGGRLGALHRYDDRMPAVLCRRAWELLDGEVSLEPVETQYGFHLVKRVEFAQQIFILFTDDAIPSIKIVYRRARQEDRMLGARAKAGVRLML
jgi:parvulin-like peptidyl-prolyl isomerase